MSDTRVCKTCQVEKPLTDFYVRKGCRDDRGYHCKRCEGAANSRRYHANPEVRARKSAREKARLAETPRIRTAEQLLDQRLWTHYRIRTAQYEQMLDRQGHACAICKSPDPGGKGTWHIDHDHRCCPGKMSCGKCVRAALCTTCNVGLGMFRDDADLLQSAVAYLAGNGS